MATAEHPTRQIELENIGAVSRLTIPVPENGGIVILRGQNGSGKSTALEAVSAAMGGRTQGLDVRDGELSGSLKGLGVKLTVGRNVRRTGELEVSSLESRLSCADLVDPHIAAAPAADAKRIKALVALSGTKADASLFYELVGGQAAYEQICSAEPCDDLVALAARVKRELEAKARQREQTGQHAANNAAGLRAAAGEVDESVETDSGVLQEALVEAVKSHEAVVNRKELIHGKLLDAAKAKKYLASKPAPDVAAYREAMDKALIVTNQADALVKSLEKQLSDAQHNAALMNERWQQADRELGAAEREAENRAIFQEDVDAANGLTEIEDSFVAESQQLVDAARQAADRGAVLREAQTKLRQADQQQSIADAERQQSERIRDMAAGTDEVLSQVVGKSGSALKVEGGRLVLDTRRGKTYFAELSEGERWKVALDIGIEAVGPGGLLTIPQEAWAALDPLARVAIAEHVAGRGVVFLTAECTSDDALTVEVFDAVH